MKVHPFIKILWIENALCKQVEWTKQLNNLNIERVRVKDPNLKSKSNSNHQSSPVSSSSSSSQNENIKTNNIVIPVSPQRYQV